MARTIHMLLSACFILVLLGTVELFSSTTYLPRLDRVYFHLAWITLGSLGCALVSYSDYSRLQRFRLPAVGLGVITLLLAITLVPGVGTVKNGASRWLWWGQPSELAKLGLILFLADYGGRNQSRMRERNAGFLVPGAAAGLIVGLVFLEPDWGTASLLGVVSLAMLAIAGAHLGYLLAAAIVGVELFVVLLLQNPLRMERLLAFLNPEDLGNNVAWQGWHSVLALGNGGWLGTFLGEGSQKNGFVPEQQTDFILSLIGEELGFLGTATIIVLFMIVLFCGARIAWRVADPFGQLLASGITVLIGLQAFINVGVVTSSLPNKGIALPLVSYGGSNLVCMLLGLGLLISVARHGPILEETVEPSLADSPPRPQIRGPVGSLLESSLHPPPRSFWRKLARPLQRYRGSGFPALASRSYQRPPCARLDT